MRALSENGLYIPGGDINSSFANLKAMFCGKKGLQGKVEDMRRLAQFTHLDVRDPTENKLLEEVDTDTLNPRNLDVLEATIDQLHERCVISDVVVVRSISKSPVFFFFFNFFSKKWFYWSPLF